MYAIFRVTLAISLYEKIFFFFVCVNIFYRIK